MKSLTKFWISSSLGRVLETARPHLKNTKTAFWKRQDCQPKEPYACLNQQ